MSVPVVLSGISSSWWASPFNKTPRELPTPTTLYGLPRKPKSWGIFPILFAAFLPSLLSFFLLSFLKQSCVSPLAPSYHCISWWPNTLTPKATHRKPTTWDGRRDQLWLRLTSREHPSWGRLSPGRLMEAYFTSCHSFLWSFCQTGGDSYSSFPLSSCTLVIYSLYIPLPKKWLQSPSCSQVEDRTFFKPIFTTIFCIFIIHSTNWFTEFTIKIWIDLMSLSHIHPPYYVPIKGINCLFSFFNPFPLWCRMWVFYCLVI